MLIYMGRSSTVNYLFRPTCYTLCGFQSRESGSQVLPRDFPCLGNHFGVVYTIQSNLRAGLSVLAIYDYLLSSSHGASATPNGQ